MKNVVRIALLVVIATWSINACAENKKHNKDKTTDTSSEQTPVHFESYQLGPLEVEKIPSKDFEKTWLSVGKELGYPKVSTSDNQDSPLGNINIEYADQLWLSSDWEQWDKFNNNIKFFLAGFFTKYKVGKNHKLTPEDFKSYTMGYYQCVNTVTTISKMVRENGMNIGGSVEEVFKNCGMGRI